MLSAMFDVQIKDLKSTHQNDIKLRTIREEYPAGNKRERGKETGKWIRFRIRR